MYDVKSIGLFKMIFIAKTFSLEMPVYFSSDQR